MLRDHVGQIFLSNAMDFQYFYCHLLFWWFNIYIFIFKLKWWIIPFCSVLIYNMRSNRVEKWTINFFLPACFVNYGKKVIQIDSYVWWLTQDVGLFNRPSIIKYYFINWSIIVRIWPDVDVIIIIKKVDCNIVCTTRFWNNLHSPKIIILINDLKVWEQENPKSLSRITKIGTIGMIHNLFTNYLLIA